MRATKTACRYSHLRTRLIGLHRPISGARSAGGIQVLETKLVSTQRLVVAADMYNYRPGTSIATSPYNYGDEDFIRQRKQKVGAFTQFN